MGSRGGSIGGFLEAVLEPRRTAGRASIASVTSTTNSALTSASVIFRSTTCVCILLGALPRARGCPLYECTQQTFEGYQSSIPPLPILWGSETARAAGLGASAATPPRRLQRINYTASIAPPTLHHIDFTASFTPHGLHHIYYATEIAPHGFHRIDNDGDCDPPSAAVRLKPRFSARRHSDFRPRSPPPPSRGMAPHMSDAELDRASALFSAGKTPGEVHALAFSQFVQPMRRQGAASSACRQPPVLGGFLCFDQKLTPPASTSARRREKSPGRLSARAAADRALPPLTLWNPWGQRGGGVVVPGGAPRSGRPARLLWPDSSFCTVAGSCRIVAAQLPDSCRLCFTQLPSFCLEKGLY